MAVAAQRDEETTASILTDWLAQRVGTEVKVSDLSRPSAGSSNETVFFTAAWADTERNLVLRVEPTGNQLYEHIDVLLQANVMRGLAGTPGLALPEVLWTEATADPMGAPFYVMGAVDGHVLADVPSFHGTGWLVKQPVAVRTALADGALRALSAVHAVDWRRDLRFLDRPERPAGIAGVVASTESFFRWMAEGRDLGIMDAAMAHVLEHAPDDDDQTLLWGDARYGNMIFADDGSVAAVLDWEFAEIGPVGVDLGWWLMFDEFISTGFGQPRAEGMPDREGTIARYEELAGRKVNDVRYYEILAGLRFATIISRGNDLKIAAGLLDPQTTMSTNNPMTQILARWLDLDVPELAPEFLAFAAASTEV
jgi:aminoglycoside phosphotransferase (APT) family kinase protein